MDMQLQWIRQSSVKTALAMHFLNSAIGCLILIYVNALFVGSYPTSWLPYFFIGQTIVDGVIALLTGSYLARNSVKATTLLYLGSACIIFIFSFLLYQNWILTPLIFSILLLSIGLLINVMTWNNTRAAFDLYELKRLSHLIIFAGSIGNLLFSLLAILLFHYFNIKIVLPLLIIMILLIGALNYLLKPLPEVPEKLSHGVNVWQYSLFRKLALIVFTIAISYTLVDYSFKYSLSTQFQMHEIAQFMSVFMAATSIVSLIVSFSLTQFLLNRFGPGGLLLTLPVYWVMTSLVVVLMPVVWVVAIMSGARYIFYYSIFNLGREYVLNVLPAQIKVKAQLQIKSICSPLGVGVATLIIFLFSVHMSIQLIAMIVCVLNLFLFVYILTLRSSYVETLKETIYYKRFTVKETEDEDELSTANHPLNTHLSGQDIQRDIVSDDEHLSLAALDKVKELQMTSSIPTVIEHLRTGLYFLKAKKILSIWGKESLPYLMSAMQRDGALNQQRMIIKIIAAIPEDVAEHALIELAERSNILTRSYVAEEVAYRAGKMSISQRLKQASQQWVIQEENLIYLLNYLEIEYLEKFIQQEINSRRYIAKKCLLNWLAAVTNPHEVQILIEMLISDSKQLRAKAFEILNMELTQNKMLPVIVDLFRGNPVANTSLVEKKLDYLDDWLLRMMQINSKVISEINMEQIQRIAILRQVTLFHNLPGETLLAIAEDTQVIKGKSGEKIFSLGDAPTGLYIVTSGRVQIIKNAEVLKTLETNEFFGELALLDNEPRSADAIAQTDCELLFLDKITFNRLTDDIPEVLRAVVRVILGYLRFYITHQI